MTHPQLRCYTYHKCRCADCRAHNAAYHRALYRWHKRGIVRQRGRDIVESLDLTPLPRVHNHPSITCYKSHGCRCAQCKALNAQRARERRERHSIRARAGVTWQDVLNGAPDPAEHGPSVLPPDELARLRRLVGLSS